jgi:ribokinase
MLGFLPPGLSARGWHERGAGGDIVASAVVVGSINIDLVAEAPHLPVPGETVLGTGFARHPGGKGANQAVASARAAVPTAMVGCVGDDEFGTDLVAFLDRQGVDTAAIGSAAGYPTGTALIVVDERGENSIVVVPGANAVVGESALDAVAIGPGDVVVAQFETPVATTLAAFARAHRAGARTVLNPAPAAPVGDELLALTDVLVVNEIELAQVSGHDLVAEPDPTAVADAAAAVGHGRDLAVVATLGAHGVVAVFDGKTFVRPARPVPVVVDTTGAGDCFVGSLAARLVEGAALAEAIEFSLAAAALCVQHHGAGSSMRSRAEIDAELFAGA